MNLGRGSKRKGRGKVVGKVVYHESRMWFKEERKGESTSTDWLSSTYVGRKGKTMTNAVCTSVMN